MPREIPPRCRRDAAHIATAPRPRAALQVPADDVLGEVGKGYKYAIEILNEGRIGIGAQMIGLAQARGASRPRDRVLGRISAASRRGRLTRRCRTCTSASSSARRSLRSRACSTRWRRCRRDAEGAAPAASITSGAPRPHSGAPRASQVAQMATEVHAARLLVYNSARMKEQGQPFVKEAAMAKLYASQAR